MEAGIQISVGAVLREGSKVGARLVDNSRGQVSRRLVPPNAWCNLLQEGVWRSLVDEEQNVLLIIKEVGWSLDEGPWCIGGDLLTLLEASAAHPSTALASIMISIIEDLVSLSTGEGVKRETEVASFAQVAHLLAKLGIGPSSAAADMRDDLVVHPYKVALLTVPPDVAGVDVVAGSVDRANFNSVVKEFALDPVSWKVFGEVCDQAGAGRLGEECKTGQEAGEREARLHPDSSCSTG